MSEIDDMAQALRVIRQHVSRDPSALAASIIATCDEALLAHDTARAQPASSGWPLELLASGFKDFADVIGYLSDIDSEVARITGDEGEDSSLVVLRRIPSQQAQPASLADGWVMVPVKMTTEIEDEMVRVWNHGPYAVLAAVHRGARKALAAAPQPQAKDGEHHEGSNAHSGDSW